MPIRRPHIALLLLLLLVLSALPLEPTLARQSPQKRTLVTVDSYAQAVKNGFTTIQAFYLRWQVPLKLFLVWRIVLGLVPFLAALILEPNKRSATSPFIIPNFYTGTADFWYDRLLAVWGRWDGEWYLQIVYNGYTPPESAPAFFPLYPTLVKLLGNILFDSYLLAGILVSGLASVIAFVLFYNLTWRDFNDKKLAGTSLLMFALCPTAFFMSALYTEALFLGLVLAAFFLCSPLKEQPKMVVSWLLCSARSHNPQCRNSNSNTPGVGVVGAAPSKATAFAVFSW